MADEQQQHRHRKRRWIEAVVGLCLLGLVVAVAVYVRSPAFSEVVRGKVVEALENTTGGRVEMGSFHWNLSDLAFEARNLTIHGLEAPREVPYMHADTVAVRLHVVSFLGRQVSIQSLRVERPIVHVVVHDDGTTNVPPPKTKSTTGAVDQLFDLAITQADFRDGILLLNEQRLPLDFAASDVIATLSYDKQSRASRYIGALKLGKIDLKCQNFRDIAASADVQFSLWTNGLTIQSVKLTSERSTFEATGELTNFDDPHVKLSYSATLNVAQLGAVVRASQLRAGTVAIDGSAKYSLTDGLSSEGRIAARDLDYQDAGFAVRNANLNSNFSYAKDRMQLTRVAARLFGGELRGDADVRTITARPQSGVKSAAKGGKAEARSSGQEGLAHLRVSNLSLRELVPLISSRSLPLDRLQPAGAVNGSVDLGWKPSFRDAFADVALDITAATGAKAPQLPMGGSVRGRYSVRYGRMEFSALTLTTPKTQLQATGILTTYAADVKVKASANGLDELEPLLSAMGNSPLPVELNGSASFDGTVKGRLRAPAISGQLTATDLTCIYTPPQPVHLTTAKGGRPPHTTDHPLAASAPPVPRRVHIDHFSGEIEYSQASAALHNASITAGQTQLQISGSTTLDNGTVNDLSQFHVQAQVHNADIAELQSVAGTRYPVFGKLNAAVQAAGTVGNPHGNGHFSLTQAELHGRSLSAFTSNIEFAEHALNFEQIDLQARHGKVAGQAAYHFDTKQGSLNLSGRSIDLADIPEIQIEHLQSAGVADFTIKGSGSFDRPVVDAHIEIASLTLNGDKVGNLTADATTRGTQLTLSARSQFPKASFTLDGQVDLENDMPGSMKLTFAHLDVNPFLPAQVRSQVTRQASLDGTATFAGPFREPGNLTGSIEIQQFSVEVDRVAVTSDGPIELSLANQSIAIRRCTLASEDTRFTLTGTAMLGGEHTLDLSANGTVNLRLAQTLDPELTSYGTGTINVRVRGTPKEPAISGQVQVALAGLSMIDMPAGLGDLNGTLSFNRNRLDLVNVSGRMGGGYVKLAGFVTYGRTLGIDVTAQGTDIRFRYSGFSVTSDQVLHVSGTSDNASVVGNITITRFAQLPSSDLQAMFAQVNTPARIPNPHSPLNNIHLEVRIQSTPELTVETSLAKLSGDVDLRLRGTAAHPVLLGRVNIAQGDIKIAGTKYRLERGDITFLDPVRIDPVLDVDATTRVRDYDITVGLHGTLERLNTTYRSDPPLSTDDIISLLAFGRTQTENAMGGAPSPGFAESASGAILSSALNQAVTSRVSRIFGSSLIRINPSLGGPENDPNARLTLEQQVSNNITFTYVTNLARSAQEVIQFEYNINADYTLQGIRDENGVVSFDLLIRKRRR